LSGDGKKIVSFGERAVQGDNEQLWDLLSSAEGNQERL
jgi:hypothetical protein